MQWEDLIIFHKQQNLPEHKVNKKVGGAFRDCSPELEQLVPVVHEGIAAVVVHPLDFQAVPVPVAGRHLPSLHPSTFAAVEQLQSSAAGSAELVVVVVESAAVELV